jgi:2-amino-4-hydroxy-6-hydroxymethyldihydropteridine diphosphokinase / dihydropteroate synthase
MRTYLGLGSNLGDRIANLTRALELLRERGLELVRVSPVVESPALLEPDAPADWNRPFLNLAACCEARCAPGELLGWIKEIETALGRDHRHRWSPRPIDIDILLWGSEQITTPELSVPHPALARRAFVLAPLIALEPRLTVPGLGGKTLLELSIGLGHHIPLWMGIVNVTPDSFSDGGRFLDWTSVEPHVEAMNEAGAQIIDLGAESTRPGASALSAEQEWLRLAPVLERLIDKHRSALLRPALSIDTYHPEVARRALYLGVDIINDVSGLTSPEMIALAAESGADFVAMHQLSLPADPARTLPADADPCELLEQWLDERLEAWSRAGLDLNRIVFDPGIGFGKNPLQSLRLLRDAARFRRRGLRCLIGHSRKSFMKGFTTSDMRDKDLATLGASLQLCSQGVDVIRVHDVPLHTAAYRGWAQLAGP